MIQHTEREQRSTSDRVLLRKLLALVRPHWRGLALGLITLALATVGQVTIPLVLQQTVDEEIRDYRVRVVPEVPGFDDYPMVGAWRYITEPAVGELDRDLREQLQTQDRLGRTRYVLLDREQLQHAATAHQAVDDLRQQLAGPSAAISPVVALELTTFQSLPANARMALRQTGGLARNTLIMLGLLLVVAVAGYAQAAVVARVGQRVMHDLRVQLYSHLTHQSSAYLGQTPVGKLVTRVTNDVETVYQVFSSDILEFIRAIAMIAAVVTTMIVLDRRIAIVVLAAMAPMPFATELFRRFSRRAHRRLRSAVSAVNAFLSEYLSGMPIVQLFVQERRSIDDFETHNHSLRRAQLGRMYVFATFRPIVEFFGSIAAAVVLWYGARALDSNLVSLGTIIALSNLVPRVFQPMMMIAELFTSLQSAMAGAERIFATLESDTSIPERGTAQLEDARNAPIHFDDVHFAYKPQEPVLRGLSFEAPAAGMTAVVGHTGAGKTTIVNLLTRLWDVNRGTIRIGGIDVREQSLTELRTAVQQVGQDIHLFAATIRENLTLGLEIADDRILAACDAAQIGDFVRSLDHGLDSQISDGGSNVSGGQRQLLAFARILLHDPPILVLDEATSNVDSETERRLQQALTAVVTGRTSIVIAHRLSTVVAADQILVLEHGSLIEHGTHEQLLARGGTYAELYRLQFADR